MSIEELEELSVSTKEEQLECGVESGVGWKVERDHA
jgi:hypothetical protein